MKKSMLALSVITVASLLSLAGCGNSTSSAPEGKVINIEDMQPQSEDNHCAAAPARFALEMNLGWFRERGIKAGDVLRGFDRLPAAR